MNLFLSCLSLNSLYNSPFLSSFYKNANIQRFNVVYSRFSAVFGLPSFFISKSSFRHFLDSPIWCESDCPVITGNYENRNESIVISGICCIIDKSLFSHCHLIVGSEGGAIRFRFKDNTLIVRNTMFDSCSTMGSAGAISFSGDNFTMSNSCGVNCSAEICSFAKIIVGTQISKKSSFYESVISNCPSNDELGAFYSLSVLYSILNLRYTNFTQNSLLFYGSSFRVASLTELSFSFLNIERNSGKNVMLLEEVPSVQSFNKCNIINNTAEAASIILYSHHMRMYQIIFSSNIGPLATNGWFREGNLLLFQCVFDKRYSIFEYVTTISCGIDTNPATFVVNDHEAKCS